MTHIRQKGLIEINYFSVFYSVSKYAALCTLPVAIRLNKKNVYMDFVR